MTPAMVYEAILAGHATVKLLQARHGNAWREPMRHLYALKLVRSGPLGFVLCSPSRKGWTRRMA